MPYCPICKTEYLGGLTHCEDCGADLVDALPPEIPPEDPEYTFLVNVEDGPVGEAVIAMLRAYEIPYITSYEDSGSISGIFTGKSLSGINVLVPKSVLDDARELLSQSSNDTLGFAEGTGLHFEFSEMTRDVMFDVCDIYNFYAINSDMFLDENGIKIEKALDFYLSLPKGYSAYVIKNQEKTLGIAAILPYEEENSCLFQILIRPELFDERYLSGALSYLSETVEDRGFSKAYAIIPEGIEYEIELYRKRGFTTEDKHITYTKHGRETESVRLVKNI